MVEHFNQEDFERLKHEVETLVGRTIMSPKDFEHLLFNKANSEKILRFGEFVDLLSE